MISSTSAFTTSISFQQIQILRLRASASNSNGSNLPIATNSNHGDQASNHVPLIDVDVSNKSEYNPLDFVFDEDDNRSDDQMDSHNFIDVDVDYHDVVYEHDYEDGAEDYYTRDEDAILTEREDRLFVDETGQRRKVESCILVAVEDLSAKRRTKRDQYRATAADTGSSNTNRHPEEWEVYFSLEESMNEMRDLIKTSGMEIVGEITQRMNEINPRTYIGTGKVKETQDLLGEKGSCTVVFDAELSPGQQKSLENAFNKEIIQNDFLGSEQIVCITLICISIQRFIYHIHIGSLPQIQYRAKSK